MRPHLDSVVIDGLWRGLHKIVITSRPAEAAPSDCVVSESTVPAWPRPKVQLISYPT
jgi:hypothetical protein